MVMTVLEATVPSDQWAVLQGAFEEVATKLPSQIKESYLNQSASDPALWQIVTVWRSQEDLEEYRNSVETPEGILMFRAAGAQPALSRFNVQAHAKGMD